MQQNKRSILDQQDRKKMTTITIENENGIYTVSIKRDEVNLSDFIGELVDPALRAAGYSFENIEVD